MKIEIELDREHGFVSVKVDGKEAPEKPETASNLEEMLFFALAGCDPVQVPQKDPEKERLFRKGKKRAGETLLWLFGSAANISWEMSEEERWRLVELVNRNFGEDGQSEQTGSEWKMSVSYL